jgi:hypothetical protein
MRFTSSFGLGGNGRLDTGPTYFYTDDRVETFDERLAREGRTDTSMLVLPAYRADTDAHRVVQPSIADATIDRNRVDLVGIACPYATLSSVKADFDADGTPSAWVRWLLAPGCFSKWLAEDGRACLCIDHAEKIVLDSTDRTLRFSDTSESLNFSATVDLRDLVRVEESEPTAAHLSRGHGVCVSILASFEEWSWDTQPGRDPTQIVQSACISHVALVMEGAFRGAGCWRR